MVMGGSGHVKVEGIGKGALYGLVHGPMNVADENGNEGGQVRTDENHISVNKLQRWSINNFGCSIVLWYPTSH